MKYIRSITTFRGLLRKLRTPGWFKVVHFFIATFRSTRDRRFILPLPKTSRPPASYYVGRGVVVVLAAVLLTQTGAGSVLWREIVKPTPALATSITVSGKFYSDEGVTPWDCSFNRTIWVSVNGGAPVSGLCTGADGSYSVSGVSISAAHDVVTIYLQQGMFGDGTALVTRTADGSSNLTGMDLYENRVIVRHEDAGPITNTDLSLYDNNADGNIPFYVMTGDLYMSFVTTLYIWPGKIFSPGGTVIANGMAPGDLRLAHDSSMTLTAATNYLASNLYVDTGATLTLNADAEVDNIITAGTGTITTTAGTPTMTMNGGGQPLGGGSSAMTFYNFTMQGNAWTLGSDMIVTHTITFPDPNQSGSFNFNGKTLTLTGTSASIDTRGYIMANLTYNPPSTGTLTVQNNNLVSNGTLNIGTHGTLALNGLNLESQSAGAISLAGTISGAGTVLVENNNLGSGGTLSSNVKYPAPGATTVTARTFGGNLYLVSPNSPNNLVFGSGAGQTITVGGNLTLERNSTTKFDAATYNPNVTVAENWTNQLSGCCGQSVNLDMGSGTWTVGGNVDLTNMGTLNTNGGTLIMNGTGTFTSNGETLNNFTTSGAGTITFANATHTIGGNLTLGSTATYINGTSIFRMTGSSKTLDGGGKVLNALRISGSVTMQNNNLTVTNNTAGLNIDNGATLTIGAGRTLIMTGHGSANPSIVLNGTINGGGRLQYEDNGNPFDTNGTITAILMLDTVNGNVIVPARTYGGDLEIYGNTNNARTVTLGTAGSQTINIGGSLKVIGDMSQDLGLTLTGSTWNPVINVTGGVSMTKSGSGTPSITTGTSTWTVSGDLDLSNGTFTATTLNTIVMNGAGKTLTGGGTTLYKLTVSNTSGTITLSGSDVTMSATLTISGSGGSLTIASGRILTMGGSSSMILNGTLSGPGKLFYTSNSTFPTTGTLANAVFIRFDTSTATLNITARADYGSIEFYNQSGASRTITPAGGSYTLSGNFDINAATSGSDIIITATTFNPSFTIAGNLTNSQNNAATTLNMGSGTWTVSGDVDLTHLTTLNSSTGTLTMNGTGTLTTNGKTLNNFTTTGSGTITLANATHNFGGNITFGANATINAGTSTISMNALNRTMTLNGQTIANLTTTANTSILDAAALSGDLHITAGTLTAPATTLSVGGNWTNGGSFAANGGTVRLTGTNPATFNGNSTFNNLTIANLGGAKTITVTSGSTQTVTGTLTLAGAVSQLITLQSSTAAAWNINPTNAAVSYVSLSRANNQGATICAQNSVDAGNNVNWKIATTNSCVVQFTSVSGSGSEATTAVTLPVSLTFTQGVDATVQYAVTGGTATGSGIDYTLASGTATIAAGTTSTTIPLTVIDDAFYEPSETIIVSLSNPTNATLGSQSTYTYTILDNDALTHVLTYVAGANGLINGVSPQTVNDGSSGATVAAVPYDGYHFVSWSDGSTANPRTDANVTGDISVTASFAADPIAVVPVPTSGYLKLFVAAPKTVSAGTVAIYTISISNTGTADASNVKVSFTIPKYSILSTKTASTSPSRVWSCTPKTSAGSVCRLTLANLSIGATATLLAKLRIDALITGSGPKLTVTANATSGLLAAKAVAVKPIVRVHTVTRGQTLLGISRLYYGASKYWTRIQDANRKVFPKITKNPPTVRAGTKLSIP